MDGNPMSIVRWVWPKESGTRPWAWACPNLIRNCSHTYKKDNRLMTTALLSMATLTTLMTVLAVDLLAPLIILGLVSFVLLDTTRLGCQMSNQALVCSTTLLSLQRDCYGEAARELRLQTLISIMVVVFIHWLLILFIQLLIFNCFVYLINKQTNKQTNLPCSRYLWTSIMIRFVSTNFFLSSPHNVFGSLLTLDLDFKHSISSYSKFEIFVFRQWDSKYIRPGSPSAVRVFPLRYSLPLFPS